MHHAYNRYVENTGDGHQWVKYDGAYTDIPNIRDSLFICGANCESKAVWGPKTENFLATGLTIVNYGTSGALAGCLDCSSNEDYRQGGFTYRYGRMRFVNSSVRITWPEPYKEIFQVSAGGVRACGRSCARGSSR